MVKYVSKDIICAKMMHCNFRSPDMTVSDFINDELPAADVQPIRHGWWIDHEPFERKNCNVCIECSVCNTWFGHDCIPKTKFCPNCGARMDGDSE